MANIACCGMACDQCEHYPKACKGCAAENGKPFWCKLYNNNETCKRYVCCLTEKKLEHCGQCAALPCELYNVYDQRKTPAENEAKLRNQLEILKSL